VAGVSVCEYNDPRDVPGSVEFLVEARGIERVPQPHVTVFHMGVARPLHLSVRIGNPRQPALPSVDDPNLIAEIIVSELHCVLPR
jgi:hypothetical protein